MPRSKILYLWDLGNTLFEENWSLVLSGFATLEDYFISRGFDPKRMNQYDWEHEQREAYQKGWMCQNIFPGFRELLEFTRINRPFTRGNKEQLDWRAEYLNPRVGFDIRIFFGEYYSAIDRWGSNVKSQKMFDELVSEKHHEGFRTIVYADDFLENGQMFMKAVQSMKEGDPNLEYRFYHCLHDAGGLRPKGVYWEIGSLYDIMENEKN